MTAKPEFEHSIPIHPKAGNRIIGRQPNFDLIYLIANTKLGYMLLINIEEIHLDNIARCILKTADIA